MYGAQLCDILMVIIWEFLFPLLILDIAIWYISRCFYWSTIINLVPFIDLFDDLIIYLFLHSRALPSWLPHPNCWSEFLTSTTILPSLRWLSILRLWRRMRVVALVYCVCWLPAGISVWTQRSATPSSLEMNSDSLAFTQSQVSWGGC